MPILTYLKSGWTLFVGLGASLMTLFVSLSFRNRRERKRLQRQYERAKEVMDQDREIDQEHDERTEELANDIEKNKRFAADPNSSWLRRKDR